MLDKILLKTTYYTFTYRIRHDFRTDFNYKLNSSNEEMILWRNYKLSNDDISLLANKLKERNLSLKDESKLFDIFKDIITEIRSSHNDNKEIENKTNILSSSQNLVLENNDFDDFDNNISSTSNYSITNQGLNIIWGKNMNSEELIKIFTEYEKVINQTKNNLFNFINKEYWLEWYWMNKFFLGLVLPEKYKNSKLDCDELLKKINTYLNERDNKESSKVISLSLLKINSSSWYLFKINLRSQYVGWYNLCDLTSEIWEFLSKYIHRISLDEVQKRIDNEIYNYYLSIWNEYYRDLFHFYNILETNKDIIEEWKGGIHNEIEDIKKMIR